MELEIVGQSARDTSNKSYAPSRLVNLYGEATETGRVLRTVPGMVERADISGVLPRAAMWFDGRVWIAQNSRIWSVKPNFTIENEGIIPDDETTGIAGNAGAITVAANDILHVLQDGTVTTPTTHIGRIGDVVTFAQRTVVLRRAGRRLQWSAPGIPTSFNALDFATTESGNDHNLRGIELAGILWIFKERSIERWIATDTGLEYMVGSKLDVGLRGFNLVTKLPNDVFWVGHDGTARLVSQGIVSTPAVENAIAEGEPVRCVAYSHKGNRFACIVFNDRPAWCFNLATGEWHERDEDGPWSVRAIVDMGNREVAFDVLGRVLSLDGVADDAGEPLVRQIVTRTLEMGGRLFRVPRIVLRFAGGDAAATAQIRVSSDKGRTWGNRLDYPLGAVGEYERRVVLRSLGQFRALNLEITMSDAAEVPVMATVFAEVVQ